MSVHADDLTPEVRKKLGITRNARTTFKKDQVRSWSLKVLALIADLTPEQRRRVLEQAAKVNSL